MPRSTVPIAGGGAGCSFGLHVHRESARTDPVLAQALAFRGGTALYKLYLTPPARYSEDVDLVQIEPGPAGPLMDRLRSALDPWLGKARKGASSRAAPVASTAHASWCSRLRRRYAQAVDPPSAPIAAPTSAC